VGGLGVGVTPLDVVVGGGKLLACGVDDVGGGMA